MTAGSPVVPQLLLELNMGDPVAVALTTKIHLKLLVLVKLAVRGP